MVLSVESKIYVNLINELKGSEIEKVTLSTSFVMVGKVNNPPNPISLKMYHSQVFDYRDDDTFYLNTPISPRMTDTLL